MSDVTWTACTYNSRRISHAYASDAKRAACNGAWLPPATQRAPGKRKCARCLAAIGGVSDYERGRQEVLAQVREAAMFMHTTALANLEPGEEPSFEDGVSSCALSILQRLGIDLEDKS